MDILPPSSQPTGDHANGPELRRAGPDGAANWLERDLATALRRDELILHYQPRVRLQDRRIVGAEALARWPHRRRGMISPAQFIPVAERTGLIVPLGEWALRTACLQASRWPSDTVVSVNVSAVQLNQGLLSRQVESALAASNLPPQRLELELTETMLLDPQVEILLTLSALRDLGIGLALDDFGAGFTGIGLLRRLPLTIMKLDRLLARSLLRRRDDTAVVRAVIDVARALDLTTVVEGVENDQQCCALIEFGCEFGQSFFLGRPVAEDSFRRLVEAA